MEKNCCGKNVRKYRNKLSLTQRELSEKTIRFGCPVPVRRISRIENGWCSVFDYELMCFSKLLSVAPDILLNDSDEGIRNTIKS